MDAHDQFYELHLKNIKCSIHEAPIPYRYKNDHVFLSTHMLSRKLYDYDFKMISYQK